MKETTVNVIGAGLVGSGSGMADYKERIKCKDI